MYLKDKMIKKTRENVVDMEYEVKTKTKTWRCLHWKNRILKEKKKFGEIQILFKIAVTLLG